MHTLAHFFSPGPTGSSTASNSSPSPCPARTSPGAAGKATAVAVGARVSAKLTGWKKPYEGRVTDATSAGYSIEFDDGEKMVIPGHVVLR